MVNICKYLQGFIHVRWRRISSINSSSTILSWVSFFTFTCNDPRFLKRTLSLVCCAHPQRKGEVTFCWSKLAVEGSLQGHGWQVDRLATDSILQMQCCQDELKDHAMLERTKTSGGGQDDVEQQKWSCTTVKSLFAQFAVCSCSHHVVSWVTNCNLFLVASPWIPQPNEDCIL